MGTACLHESIRSICLNAVIVRMRAGETGLAMERTDDGVFRRPSSQELRLGYESTHQMRKVAGTGPAIGWTGQVRLNDDHYAQ